MRFISFLFLALMLAVSPAVFADAKPCLAVYGYVNLTDQEAWNVPLASESRAYVRLCKMLGDFTVIEAKALPRLLTDESLAAWCRENRADFLAYGMAYPAGAQAQIYQVTVFDAAKGAAVIQKTERGKAIQDAYPACGRLTLAATEALVGRHIGFASVSFANEGEKGDYTVWVDGERYGDNLVAVDRILAGKRAIKVTRPVAGADLLVREVDVTVAEGAAAKITFALAPLDKETIARATEASLPGSVRVRKGSFFMGSNSDYTSYELDGTRHNMAIPQHLVVISEFVIGTTEVTQAQYERVVGTNPSRFKVENHPVEGVTWVEACIYCNRLSMADGYSPAYVIIGDEVTWDRSADGWRLPTDAEWEYACQLGDEGSMSRWTFNCESRYVANPGEKDRKKWIMTTPVRSFEANKLGIYDMHGNVEEWCWDRFASYSGGTTETDPSGSSVGRYRVVRGGAWFSSAADCRTILRRPVNPSETAGFRVVRSVFPRERAK